jgi:antitoxin VapB
MTPAREVSLFRNGRNQALRVPREFELPGETALMYQEGRRLVIEPKAAETLADLFARWDDLDVPFPDVEDEPMPLDEEVF